MTNPEFQSPRIIEKTPLNKKQLALIHQLRSDMLEFFKKTTDVDFAWFTNGEIILRVRHKADDGCIRSRYPTFSQSRKRCDEALAAAPKKIFL